MRTRSLLSLALPMLLLVPYGCEDDTGPDAVAGHSGASGSPAAGAPGASGKSGASGSYGASGHAGASAAGSPTAGHAGSSPQAGASGQSGSTSQDPLWNVIGQAQGAPVERLKQPQLQRLFSWGPCSWTDSPDCEEASFDGFAPIPKDKGIFTVVHDDGHTVRLAVSIAGANIAVITDPEGQVLEAFRHDHGTNFISAMYIHGLRYALPLLEKSNPTPWGVLGEIGGPDPLIFQPVLPKPSLGSGSQGYALSSKRWAWWVSQAAMVSFDAFVGNPLTIFSETKYLEPPYSIEGLVEADDSFLSVEYRAYQQRAKPMILLSEGKELGAEMLPWADGYDEATPMFAHTHMAWLRAYGFKAINTYETVELWASPFSKDPSQLKPVKVMTTDDSTVSRHPTNRASGWGRAVLTSRIIEGPPGQYAPLQLFVVDLTNATPTVTIALPKNLWPELTNGVTRTHAWFTLDTPYKYPPRKLTRWKLPAGGTQPAPP